MYQHGEYDAHILTRDLGRRFEGINVSIKPYPCGVLGHPTMDAMRRLVQKHDVRPEQIAAIRAHWDEYDFFFLHFKYTDSTGENAANGNSVTR